MPSRPRVDGQSTLRPRQIRSRRGCVTCRSRKVKCNEQRPRCSHCERLNLECNWNTASRLASRPEFSAIDRPSASGGDIATPAPPAAIRGLVPGWTSPQSQLKASDVFDYSSGASSDVQTRPETISDVGLSLFFDSFDATNIEWPTDLLPQQDEQPETPPLVNDVLMDFFIHSVRPPILAEIEARKNWSTIRDAIISMAQRSFVVRTAISAFASLLMLRQTHQDVPSGREHYQRALEGVSSYDDVALTEFSQDREHLLVALFFLCYYDIIETRMDAVHLNLKRAYHVLRTGNKGSFSHVERQIFLWTRLLDARAVSAGGDGLFLADDDDAMLLLNEAESDAHTPEGHADADADDYVEDVLFQSLYQPGVVFYQRVQSFMGRISKIDPWHRSRGTVEDEIEAVNIGASIAAGLRVLYSQRPALMDIAVAGKLGAPHLSAGLAVAITRAFRTYLSNFYACRIHLHRVAYKTLPLTKEAEDALCQIRTLARQISADLGPDGSLPVTMLWPLLMLGVEETDPEGRQWIRDQIMRMDNEAGNARLTASVLEEVQAQQDASKQRMDIRSIMQSAFNSCFAIV